MRPLLCSRIIHRRPLRLHSRRIFRACSPHCTHRTPAAHRRSVSGSRRLPAARAGSLTEARDASPTRLNPDPGREMQEETPRRIAAILPNESKCRNAKRRCAANRSRASRSSIDASAHRLAAAADGVYCAAIDAATSEPSRCERPNETRANPAAHSHGASIFGAGVHLIRTPDRRVIFNHTLRPPRTAQPRRKMAVAVRDGPMRQDVHLRSSIRTTLSRLRIADPQNCNPGSTAGNPGARCIRLGDQSHHRTALVAQKPEPRVLLGSAEARQHLREVHRDHERRLVDR